MKLSIVTPSYNQGKYVRRCLESVTAQEGLEVEHIILDALSTDETGGILDEFSQKEDGVSRKILRRRDAGQTAAINEGFSIASGDIVCWLNTDEYFLPGALLAVAATFAERSDVDVLYGNCLFVDDSNQVVRNKEALPFSRSMLLYYGCFISSCATFFRRNIIDSGQFLDPSFKVCMDYEYYVRLADSGYKYSYTSRNISAFTWHENNISTIYRSRGDVEFRKVQRQHSGLLKLSPILELIFPVFRLYWKSYRFFMRGIRSVPSAIGLTLQNP